MRGKKRCFSRRLGFTLLEMMTAIAVLSTGIVAVLYGISGASKAEVRVERRATAADLLGQKISEYSSLDHLIEPQVGTFGYPFEDYGWEVDVKSTELEGLYRVEAKVSWSNGISRQSVRGETLVPQR